MITWKSWKSAITLQEAYKFHIQQQTVKLLREKDKIIEQAMNSHSKEKKDDL